MIVLFTAGGTGKLEAKEFASTGATNVPTRRRPEVAPSADTPLVK